jgi:hypothetical protein
VTLDSIRGELARLGVRAVRAAVVDAVREGPSTDHSLEGSDDGCPYCAMYPHAALAIHYCLLAANASVPELRTFYLEKAETELAAAVRAGVRDEVLASEDGRAALERVQAVADRLAAMAQGVADDLAEIARELYAVSNAIAALAEGRNAPAPAPVAGGER